MRELAHVIQAEVAALRDDTLRLDDRVNKLQTHFRQANKDIDDILISTNKVVRRGQKIEDLEMGEVTVQPAMPAPTTAPASAPVIPLTKSIKGGESGQR